MYRRFWVVNTILLLWATLHANSSNINALLEIEEGVHEYIETGKNPIYMNAAIRRLNSNKNTTEINHAYCIMCEFSADILIKYRRQGASRIQIEDLAINMCRWYVGLGDLCIKLINHKLDMIFYIIDHRPNLTAQRVCTILFQDIDCKLTEIDRWHVNIPPQESTSKIMEHLPELPPLKIVHISDLHYDPSYTVGSNANCGIYICCHNDSGQPLHLNHAAGYWGDYEPCDSPWHSIIDLFDQIQKEHDHIDYIYFTGDIVSHVDWQTGQEYNTQVLQKMYEQMKTSFKSTPVFAILGNHDTFPNDDYVPNVPNVPGCELSSKWLFNVVAEEWSRWLPNDTEVTIRHGGFYTTLVRPGFRIVALNNNVGYITNGWLAYEDKDPYEQLQWLVDTLVKAEQDGEYVHILSHVPSGDPSLWKQWGTEFYRIINRFSNTVVAQFNGHTHKSDIKVFYSIEDPEKVVNIAFNGGGFTTFANLNPNYRIYNVDSNTYQVENFDEWSYNLTEANEHIDRPPKWFKLYSFKEAFGLENLKLQSFDTLLNKLALNSTLMEQYYRFSVQGSDSELKRGCNENCLANKLCSLASVEFEQSRQCKDLVRKFHQQCSL